MTDLIGSLAAILATVSFVPQTLKSIRTGDLSGISLAMYGLFSAGVAFWMVYGVLIQSWPIIIANAITFAQALLILVLKIRSVLAIRRLQNAPAEARSA